MDGSFATRIVTDYKPALATNAWRSFALTVQMEAQYKVCATVYNATKNTATRVVQYHTVLNAEEQSVLDVKRIFQ